ncbi:MAG: hypothetical protein R3B70_02480 [Polyangiaceae bacterium]
MSRAAPRGDNNSFTKPVVPSMPLADLQLLGIATEGTFVRRCR